MTVSRAVPLSGFTTFRIGGNAEFFTEVFSLEDLHAAMRFCSSATVLGGGSNVLVSDKGVKGLVIRMRSDGIVFENGLVIADAGVRLGKLAETFYQMSFSGAEWAAMIPGTVGGACKTNAGAFGGSVGDSVQWVEVLRQGRIVRLSVSDCEFAYRGSGFLPNDIIVRAAFLTERAPKGQIAARMEEYRHKRLATQPAGKSAGSVFKRVRETGIAAGWYIDKAGFKGIRAGGAIVSTVHANFILNTGSATAADVCRLTELIRFGVKEQFDAELEEEIERIGEF